MSFLSWLDHRTGYRALVHEALYERIPGGARWRYVWGSTLVFALFSQIVTGVFLWMLYSPSAQTAWESVYYIQYETQGGWLLRAMHHYMAHTMVVLLALHFMQILIDGAYRAPREINYWLGLLMALVVLALSLTGYLLPWDQKGYWATRVATNLVSLVPFVGSGLQRLVVGGPDYGHHTLTKFFALHAGVLPGLLLILLVLHVALFRRHGICHKEPARRPEVTFWPDQVLRDGVACLAVLLVVLLLSIHFDVLGLLRGAIRARNAGAGFGPPADPSTPYAAARPDWQFLFLFQFLKLFEGHGESGERWGAIFIPGLVMAVVFAMPFIGRWKLGHRFNIGFVCAILVGIAVLSGSAWWEDNRARWSDPAAYAEIAALSRQLGNDPQRIAAHFGGDERKIADYRIRMKQYEAYRKSANFLAAQKHADVEGQRARELAAGPNRIPPAGALAMLREDAYTQGPRIFAQNCAGCHSYFDPDDAQSPAAVEQLAGASAPSLYGFASRRWIAGLLDKKSIAGPEYFGSTTRFKELVAKHQSMEMVDFVKGDMSDWPKEEVEQVAAALSAQAELPRQKDIDHRDRAMIEAGAKLIADENRCAACHRFEPGLAANDPKLKENELNAPDLSHYGSREWLIGMVCNPAADRYYGKKNDRMPAFAASDEEAKNRLTRRQIEFIADWLRGDYWTGTSQ